MHRLGAVASFVEKKNQFLYQVISRKLRLWPKECCSCDVRDSDLAILKRLAPCGARYLPDLLCGAVLCRHGSASLSKFSC